MLHNKSANPGYQQIKYYCKPMKEEPGLHMNTNKTNYDRYIDSICDDCRQKYGVPTKVEFAIKEQNIDKENNLFTNGHKYYCPQCNRITDDGQDAKKNKIETIIAQSVSDFLQIIKDTPRAKWFRGTANESYSLKPEKGRIKIGDFISDALKKEYTLFSEFERYIPYFEKISGNDLAFLAQHYGLPTRLLDWTSSPLVALFFATRSREHNGSVYILNNIEKSPPSLEYKSLLNEGGVAPKTSETYLVIPSAVTSRLITQSGIFTLHSDPFIPLTDEVLKKIIIPENNKESFFSELEQLGVHYFSLFPDMAGLAQWLKAKHWEPALPNPIRDFLLGQNLSKK